MKTAIFSTALCTFFLILFVNFSAAQSCHESGPQVHALAPAGVMGSHTHPKGEWMLHYNFMYMNMGGHLTGTQSLTTEQVLGNYMMAGESMNMRMHMLGAMYAISDRVTLMGMMNFVSNDMVMKSKMMHGDHIHYHSDIMHNSGIGDANLTVLYRALKKQDHCLHFGLGMNLPVGSINQTTHAHGNTEEALSYRMRPGSGTYNLQPMVNYSSIFGNYSAGAQANASLPLHRNSKDYHMGSSYTLTAWGARKITPRMSSSARILATKRDKCTGADMRLNPMMMPEADPHLQGGERVDALLGLNFRVNNGFLQRTRFGLEVGLPVYQNLNGPQMATGVTGNVGVMYSF